MFERSRTLNATVQPTALGHTSLANCSSRQAAQPKGHTDDFRAQYVVRIGHRIDSTIGRLTGKAKRTPDSVVRPFGIDVQELHIQPLEEGMEEGLGRHRDLHIGIDLAKSPQGVRQHRHIPHGRGADHKQMARQSIFSRHKVQG